MYLRFFFFFFFFFFCVLSLMSATGSVVVFNTYLFLTYGAVITVEYVIVEC